MSASRGRVGTEPPVGGSPKDSGGVGEDAVRTTTVIPWGAGARENLADLEVIEARSSLPCPCEDDASIYTINLVGYYFHFAKRGVTWFGRAEPLETTVARTTLPARR